MKCIKVLLNIFVSMVLCSCHEYWATPSSTELHFGASLSSNTIEIESNESWTLTCSESWFRVNPSIYNVDSEDSAVKTPVQVYVDRNTQTTEREGELILNCLMSGKMHIIKIVQEAAEMPIVDVIGESSYSFNQEGGKFMINIESDDSWILTSDKNWCVPSQSQGSGSKKVEVLVEANPNGSERESKLIVTGQTSHTEIIIMVCQAGTDKTASVAIGKESYDEKDSDIDSKTEYSLSVSPSSLNFYAVGGSQDIRISGNDTWSASSNSNWCKLSQASGTGSFTLNVVASKNTASNKRSATITIKGSKSGKTFTIDVTQEAGGTSVIGKGGYDEKDSDIDSKTEYSLSVNPSSLNFNAVGGSQDIRISGNDTWSASSNSNWCKLSKSSGIGDSVLNVTTSKNTTSNSRYATITIKGEKTNKTFTIEVSQDKGGSTVIGKGEFN